MNVHDELRLTREWISDPNLWNPSGWACEEQVCVIEALRLVQSGFTPESYLAERVALYQQGIMPSQIGSVSRQEVVATVAARALNDVAHLRYQKGITKVNDEGEHFQVVTVVDLALDRFSDPLETAYEAPAAEPVVAMVLA